MSESETEGFEPRIVAFVCNWCTYLGADLAGTNRLEYPSNVRIVRLPCTGRIDFNLPIKAFEMGADAVLVSGCHPGDCHYTSGNYHARRRWMLFRELLSALGFEMARVHFTWISAAEGRKWQQVISDITDQTRKLGPCRLYAGNGSKPGPPETAAAPAPRPAAPPHTFEGQDALRESARRLLANGTVDVVIGHGERGAPVFVTCADEANQLAWNDRSHSNLTTYLKRKEIKALGRPAIVVKGCDERALVVLEKESQIDRRQLHVIGMACDGIGAAKCDACDVRMPRHADEVIGQATGSGPSDQRFHALSEFLQRSPSERMAYWAAELERCVKCYACRQVCPLCYCERCVADKNRPTVIDTSATLTGNFAWHITRAFHLAARCVGCDECTRACPAGIDLRLLNLSVARAAEDQFGYRAGMDPQAEPPFGSFSLEDKESFIR